MLTAAAPSGGGVVALSSSNPATAGVPSSVTVPAGSTAAVFSDLDDAGDRVDASDDFRGLQRHDAHGDTDRGPGLGAAATSAAGADGSPDPDGERPQRRPRHEQSRRSQCPVGLQRVGLVHDRIVNHAERGERPRRGVLGCVLDAAEGEELHVHAQRRRRRDRERAVRRVSFRGAVASRASDEPAILACGAVQPRRALRPSAACWLVQGQRHQTPGLRPQTRRCRFREHSGRRRSEDPWPRPLAAVESPCCPARWAWSRSRLRTDRQSTTNRDRPRTYPGTAAGTYRCCRPERSRPSA